MNQLTYTITENAPLTADVYRMTLTGDVTAKYPQVKPKKPGGLFGKLFGK